jgi:hypothetical protein
MTMLKRLYGAVAGARPDLRDRYIARVVRGKSFADVGGLWGTVAEKVSVARRHGAIAATMIDVSPPESELWQAFARRMRSRRVRGYQTLSRDVCALRPGDVPRPFEVVHCSGVLYHHPSPLALLAALRAITAEHLILTTAITAETVANRRGRYRVPASGVIFVPALTERERAVLAAHWERVAPGALGITRPASYDVADFGPWWWLPTARAAAALCESAGFLVLDQGLTWRGNALTLLLKAR